MHVLDLEATFLYQMTIGIEIRKDDLVIVVEVVLEVVSVEPADLGPEMLKQLGDFVDINASVILCCCLVPGFKTLLDFDSSQGTLVFLV